MESKLILALGDPDPKVRYEAVKAVMKQGDYEALQYLATVFREDKDERVREAARRAGLRLREVVYVPGTPGLMDDQPAQRSNEGGDAKLTWGSVAVELVVFTLLVTLGYVIQAFLSLELIDSMLETMDDSQLDASVTLTRDIIEAGMPMLILNSVLVGIVSVLAFVVQVYVIHYIATSSFGGRGSELRLLQKLMLPNVLWFVGGFVLSVMVLSLAGSLFNDMAFTSGTGEFSDAEQFSSSVITLIYAMCCGIPIAFIALVWYLNRTVARHYRIQGGQALLALLAGGIGSLLMTNLLTSVINSFIGTLV